MFDGLVQAADRVAALEVGPGLADGSVGVEIVVDVAVVRALA